MKVLFVTLFPLENNTSVTISNYGILRGLHQLGHDVTILMPYASDTAVSIPYDVSMFRIVRIEGMPFDQLRKAPAKQTLWFKIKRKWRKHFEFLDFTRPYLKSVKSVPILNEYFDLVISTSDPKTSHVFVQKMKQNGLTFDRWIQHWGDPMYGDITRSNSYPNWIIKWYERRIIKQADKVVYVSPFTADMLREVHPMLSNRIDFVPLPCEEITEEPMVHSESNVLKLAYLGDYSPSIRNILPLYEAVNNMDGVHLTIAGISSLKLENTDKVKVLPRIPQNESHQLEMNSDVSVTVCNLRGTQIPGKVYYAAASQKHMLVILDGDKKDLLKEYVDSFGRYIVCENTIESIQTALRELQENKDGTKYTVPEIFLPENNADAILKFNNLMS